MYQSKYNSELRDEVNFGKRTVLWVIALLFIVSGATWAVTRTEKTAEVAILHYEEFQEIFNTCQKINTDLATIRQIDEHDPMFAQFSKASVVAQKRQQLARWVEDYNAKSKMWNRTLWKSSALPYQLSVSDFPNYDGGAR